jgi:phosphoribosylformylglycinamidine synthase
VSGAAADGAPGSAARDGASLPDDGIALSREERARIAALLGREPTRVELHVFDAQWSEHCSYKSSRALLGRLPTEGPTVILGPGEDAGILRLPDFGGASWGLVVAHESHNHPSQVVPEEGAATGIGGIVRDVSCMGADVIGVLDGLRFGDPAGPRGRRVAEIARGVVSGIRHYGNAIGVPNLGGDVVFHPSFDENCLVNVVAVGIVRADAVVPSAVPREAAHEDFALLLVGKPTDETGMGGATLASRLLDGEKNETDRGAVQAADPFLKRVLLEANRAVFDRLLAARVPFGMKDLGAGGLGGMAVEIAAKGGFGMAVDLDRVHRVDEALPAEVIACAETQERFGLVVPARVAAQVLAIYNDAFALPQVHRGARAVVVGRVLREPLLRLVRGGAAVAELPTEALVAGVRVERPARARDRLEPGAPAVAPAGGAAHVALLERALAGVHGGSRALLFRYYDTEVQGRALLRPGESDAAVLRPIPDAPFAVAVSLDGNPRLGLLAPREAAHQAVCEGVRNVVCSGGYAIGLTDCLNFGSPEDAEVYSDFAETIDGLAEAARALGVRGHEGAPLPFVSGNVSFYNESVSGRAIAPSPIVATFGLLEGIELATPLSLQEAGSALLLLGPRGGDLGGSLLEATLGGGALGRAPCVDLAGEAARARAVEDAIRARRVLAAHDVSEGGLLVTLAEMAMASHAERGLGLRVDRAAFADDGAGDAAILWSEAGGYVLEVAPRDAAAVEALAAARGARALRIGETTRDGLITLAGFGDAAARVEVARLARAWERGLASVFPAYGDEEEEEARR